MTRNLKTLGLALVAALAMSAMAASVAQATNGVFTTGVTTPSIKHTAASLHAVQYAKAGGTGMATENNFEAFAGARISCTNVSYTASATGTDKDLTVTPSYSHCGLVSTDDTLKPPVTVTMNGCTYTFTQPIKLAANEYTSRVDLNCPGTGPMVHVAAGGNYTAEFGNLCTIETTAGQNLGHVILHNNFSGTDDITGTVNITGIHTTEEGLCGGKTETGAKLVSNITLTAQFGHDVWISDEAE